MPAVRQLTAPVCVVRDALVTDPYRYQLLRVWDRDQPLAGWILLNPSVLDPTIDDPTITRLMIRTRMWGFGGILVGNALAQAVTYPEDLGADGIDPVGPDNEEHLKDTARRCEVVIVGWGSHRRMRTRGPEVYRTLRWADPDTPIQCLGHNADGSPKHPLYMAYSVAPVDFRGPRDGSVR